MEIFSQYKLHNISKIFTDGKKVLSTETLIIKSQSCDKFPVFAMFTCFPFKWNHSTIHNSNLSKPEGRIPQIVDKITLLLNLIVLIFNFNFNGLGWLTYIIIPHVNYVMYL